MVSTSRSRDALARKLLVLGYRAPLWVPGLSPIQALLFEERGVVVA